MVLGRQFKKVARPRQEKARLDLAFRRPYIEMRPKIFDKGAYGFDGDNEA